ncbi:MAG: TonB-dependent receptor [Pseudomonadota bacterium]
MKLSIRLLASTIILAVTPVAYSQDTNDDEKLDEVIVTGQKIARSLQDTPASVSVMTAAEIEEHNLIDLKDVYDKTANITTTDGSTFRVRGINSLNVSGAGLGDLASVYVDGSPLPRDATLAGPLDVWDLEQIEIFRGPQSTLQGRNALAGAVILNTARPTFDWEGRARVVIGDEDNERRYAGAISGPLVDDQLAFRLSAESSSNDGLVRNVTAGGFEDEFDSMMVRGKLLIEPESIEDLSILLSYTIDEREFGDYLASNTVANSVDNRISFANRRFRDNTDLSIGVATVNYDFSDEWSLTSITALNVTERDFESDGDRTPVDAAFSFFESETETLTQELRLQLVRDRFTGVFGAYISDIDTTESLTDATLNLDILNDLGLVNILIFQFGLDPVTANTIGSFYTQPVSIRAQGDNPFSIETYAAFADFTYDLSDKWTLFGGLRYDNERQQITVGNLVTADETDLPNPALFPPTLAPTIALINGFLIQQAEEASEEFAQAKSPSFDAWLPKLGFGYEIDGDKSVSFTVQRGYRSGGIGINSARAESFEFDQEFIWNYELSFRSVWLDNALVVNANVFYIDWEDQQVRVQLSGNIFDVETQNAGSSKLKGFELESWYDVSENLEIYGSIGYAESEFTEFTATISGVDVDLSGNEFAFAPKLTVAAGATWRNDKGYLVNVNANYNSAAFTRADRPQNEREIDARTLLNMRAGWENDNYGIYVTGNNLLDEAHLHSLLFASAGDTAPDAVRYGAPRTFALQFEARF